MFKFYNPNPKGKMVGDCIIRAICAVDGLKWEECFAGLVTEAYYLCDMPSSNYVWGSYLKSKGYIRENLPDACPECYTVGQFAKEHKTGKYIAATGTHAVAIISGDVYDSWDSTNEIVSFYWKKVD